MSFALFQSLSSTFECLDHERWEIASERVRRIPRHFLIGQHDSKHADQKCLPEVPPARQFIFSTYVTQGFEIIFPRHDQA